MYQPVLVKLLLRYATHQCRYLQAKLKPQPRYQVNFVHEHLTKGTIDHNEDLSKMYTFFPGLKPYALVFYKSFVE